MGSRGEGDPKCLGRVIRALLLGPVIRRAACNCFEARTMCPALSKGPIPPVVLPQRTTGPSSKALMVSPSLITPQLRPIGCLAPAPALTLRSLQRSCRCIGPACRPATGPLQVTRPSSEAL